MQEDEKRELETRIASSCDELETVVGNYSGLMAELAELRRALEAGAGGEQIDAAWRAFTAHPRLVSARAASEIEDGLAETRALAELLNRIIVLRDERARRD